MTLICSLRSQSYIQSSSVRFYAFVLFLSKHTLEFAVRCLADFRAIARIIYVLLNQTGSLWGAWKQATRRRLLHGAKANGEGG
jgi:hypothetical protein